MSVSLRLFSGGNDATWPPSAGIDRSHLKGFLDELYSEDYYADDDDVDALDTDAPRQIDLYVKKNRPHGLTGRVRFDFDKETMNFSSAV